MKIYLDDIRQPSWTYPSEPDEDWVICRDFAAFKQVLDNQVNLGDFPEVISFDHDLGDGIPTGMDAVKYLVYEVAMKIEGWDLRDCDLRVHSANVAGHANMKGLLESYVKFLNQEAEEADE